MSAAMDAFKTGREARGRQPLKAIAFVRSNEIRRDLLLRVSELPEIELTIATNRRTPATEADFIFIEVDFRNADDLAFVGEINGRVAGEPVEIIAITSAATPQDVLGAVRAGAEDVLIQPIEIKEIRDVVSRIASRRAKGQAHTAHRGRLLTFAHVSGGVGATTLAVNSAVALAQGCERNDVCLLDFDIQFGSVAAQLDIPPSSSIAELVQDPDRLDREMFEHMTVRHSSGLRVLTAPRLPLPMEAFDGRFVARLLETAQSEHRFIVVDLPRVLGPWTDTVFRASNIIYVVTQLSVPAIHQLKKFFDLLVEEHLDDLPFRLVVNRHQGPFSKGSNIPPAQFEHVINRSIDHYIPNDYNLVITGINQGRPAIAHNKAARISQSIRDMLADVSGPGFFEDRRPVLSLSGLAKKLFGGRNV